MTRITSHQRGIGATALAMIFIATCACAGEVADGARRKGFTVRSLDGSCAWQSVSIRTDRAPNTSSDPATMVGLAEFDGRGDIVISNARTNFDGINVNTSYTGTYSINASGGGQITFNFASPASTLIYDFQLSPSGHVMRFIREEDIAPEPIGSGSAAVSSERLSAGVCKFDE